MVVSAQSETVGDGVGAASRDGLDMRRWDRICPRADAAVHTAPVAAPSVGTQRRGGEPPVPYDTLDRPRPALGDTDLLKRR